MQRKALWVVVLFTFAALLPFAGNYFASDDFDLIFQLSKGGPFAIWSHAPALFFRPLVSLSLWLNFQAGGWSSVGYNLTNFALHASCAGFTYVIARRLGGTRPVSAVAALLFAMAPAHAEATFWISCRTDLLGAFFGLAAVATGLTALEKKSAPLAVAAVLAFALAACSKESVYALFLFFWVLAIVKKPRPIGIGMALGTTVAVVVAAYLRSNVVTESIPYAAQIDPPKMAVKGAMMLVRPMVPVDPQVVAHGAGLQPANWGVVVLVAAVGAWLAWRLTSSEVGQEKVSLLVPLAGFFFAAAPATLFSMPLLSAEGGRFMYLPSAFGLICGMFIAARWLSPRALQIVAAAALFLAAGFNSINGYLYGQAAERCRTTLETLRTQPPTPGAKLPVELPDTIGGRYVWRNGFPQAVEVFAPEWKEQAVEATAN